MKRIIMVLLATILLITTIPALTENSQGLSITSKNDSCNLSSSNAIFQKGDYVSFGTYPQTSAGDDNTPIEWLVLDTNGTKVLLLSKYGLDCVPYNQDYDSTTWEESTIRKWLNEDFFFRAFNSQEREAILLTDVNNSASQGSNDWSFVDSHNSYDHVFLLSYHEADRYLGAQSNSWQNIEARVQPTEYAIKNGAFCSFLFLTTESKPAGRWWLRTHGMHGWYADTVTTEGFVTDYDVDDSGNSVRPVLWVDINTIIINDHDGNLDYTEHNNSIECMSTENIASRNVDLDLAYDENNLQLNKCDKFDVANYVSSNYYSLGNWLTLSMSRNSGLFIEPVANQYKIMTYYNGDYHDISISETRGVQDRNKNLQRYAWYLNDDRYKSILGKEGVIYSPDGRYAAILNTQNLVEDARWDLDPIIIDLSTGELILTATYSNSIIDNMSGAVVSACFSADNRYYYYLLYGNINGARMGLFQYDLVTGKTQLCYMGDEYPFYSYLSETRDGSLIFLNDQYSKDKHESVCEISLQGDSWIRKENCFDLPVRVWYSTQMQYSSLSGYAVALGQNSQIHSKNFYGFQLFMPDAGFAHLNEYLVIKKASNQLTSVSAEELQNVFIELSGTNADNKIMSEASDFPYQMIEIAKLSPDGHYLLLITSNGIYSSPDKHLYLVNLDDLSMKEVQGIDPSTVITTELRNYSYRPVIEWNTDVLLIYTKDGILTYSFTLNSKLKETADTENDSNDSERITGLSATTDDMYQPGNYVSFGTFTQTKAGDDDTPIEWLVLARDGEKALLISKYGLECLAYGDYRETWEDCLTRGWLNRVFYNKAFNASERKAILLTDIDNSIHQWPDDCDSDGGNNTQDKIFLLSYAEAWKYFTSETTRQCSGTEFSWRIHPEEEAYSGSIYWRLRSPDTGAYPTMCVDDNGMLTYCDEHALCWIRPALWVNLDYEVFN